MIGAPATAVIDARATAVTSLGRFRRVGRGDALRRARVAHLAQDLGDTAFHPGPGSKRLIAAAAFAVFGPRSFS